MGAAVYTPPTYRNLLITHGIGLAVWLHLARFSCGLSGCDDLEYVLAFFPALALVATALVALYLQQYRGRQHRCFLMAPVVIEVTFLIFVFSTASEGSRSDLILYPPLFLWYAAFLLHLWLLLYPRQPHELLLRP
jgi:hypothetical protein